MDSSSSSFSKLSAPQEEPQHHDHDLPHSSGSSSSSSVSSASSSDSEIIDENKSSSALAPGLGSDDADSETEGFVSGEEDFDAVLDRAFVRDEPIPAPAVVADDSPVKLVSSSEFFIRPIAKVSLDDDDSDSDEVEEEDGVGGGKEEVFKDPEGVVESENFGELVRENGVSRGIEAEEKIENSRAVEEEEDEEGDAVVEAVHVSVTHTGAAVVGDVEKIEESEIKGLEIPAGVSLENEFEQIRGDEVEETKASELEAVDSEAEGVVDVAEPAVEKLVEESSVDITNGGDTVVQEDHVDLLHTGAAIVGDVDKVDESEIKGLEVPAGVSLDNGFEKISGDVELPVESELVDVSSESDNVVVPELRVEKSVEENDAGITSEGDSVVQAVHVDLSHSGAAVVGDVEKVEESEIKGLKIPAGVSLLNGFDQISREVELHSESDKVVVAESGVVEEKAAGADEVDSLEGKEKDIELSSDSATGQEGSTVEVGATEEEKVVSEETQFVNHVSDSPQHEPADVARVDSVDNQLNAPESFEKCSVDREIKIEEEEEEHSKDEGGVESLEPSPVAHQEISVEAEDDEGDDDDKDDEEETDGMIFGSSAAAKQFLEELERESGTGSYSGAESYGDRSVTYRDDSQRVDGQIVTDSDEEVDTDEEGGGKELFDSAALAALLKAATGGAASADGGNVTFTSPDGSRLFTVERPAGLGSSMRPMKPGARPNPSSLFSNAAIEGDSDDNLSEEEKKKLEKFQQIRVKFLRLAERLGVSTDDSIAKQVLYRLALVSGRQSSREFSFEAAKSTALELEADGKDFDFSLNILVLGKSGVGKSATINSIFGEEKTPIYAFGPSTTTVKEVVGVVNGIKIKVFDTPGLKSGAMEQNVNRKILSSVQKFTKKCPVDIVLYVDRLDTQSRDLNDVPVLRTITSVFGPSIWRSTIVTLTHAASAPPDGPSGSPLNYELFVAQRSQILQQTIGQAIGDIRYTNPNLMSPISLVENHPSCRKNREGEKVLPNGQSWRPQLLLLSSSMKVLAEANALSKPAEPFDHRKLFGLRTRQVSLPYLLSWLLQSRTHPKLAGDQGENADSDIDLADLSDSDNEEEEDEYDQLPSFKPLKKAQIAKLSKEQKKAYLEEYDYRVNLLQKKMWREELKRMKEMKKGNKPSADEYAYLGEEDPENAGPAAVPVALPDMVLPPSFDSENPAYRYRFLEPTSQFLARPVLDAQGWDHDCGYDGVNLEFTHAIASTFPSAVAIQVTKDKKEFNLHLDSSAAAKHGENGSSMAGFEIQNVGKQLAYIVRGETKWKNLKKNKTTAGVSVTIIGENVSTGVKIEDQLALGKRLVLVGSAGTVRSQGDSAYGANLEFRVREADFPIGQDQSVLGFSLVKWRGDLALGANLQSQFSLGRSYKVAVRAGLNNKRSGQISIRTSSSEQLQIALVAVLPIVRSIYNHIFPGASPSEGYSIY